MRLLLINAGRILVQGKCVLTGDYVGYPLHLKFTDLPLIGMFTVQHTEVLLNSALKMYNVLKTSQSKHSTVP